MMNNFQKELVLKQIACEIKKNRNNLHSNLRNLRVYQKDNKFLRQVYGDYKDYHNFIINQKKDQEIQNIKIVTLFRKKYDRFKFNRKNVTGSKARTEYIIRKII